MTGFVGILEEPVSHVALYERLFGDEHVSADADRLIVDMARSRLTLLSPGRFARDYPEVEIPWEKGISGLVVARFRVRSLESLVDFLKHYGIPTIRHGPDVLIDPNDACGAALQFAGDER